MSDGSILKNLSIYEKMLQNPKNQKRTYMKQNMPSMSELKGAAGGKVDLSNVAETVSPGSSEYLSAEQEAEFADIDARMSKRWSGERSDKDLVTEQSSSRVAKLEKDVNELKDMMMMLMKTHMKLLNNG